MTSKDNIKSLTETQRSVVFICGPTASGKSDLALQIAQGLSKDRPVSLINCDSVQVYQDLLIGSAAPSVAEKALFPHYLYNYIGFPEEVSLGSYYRDFAETLQKIDFDHGILVVGGSGFYLQALEHGLFDMPSVSSELREAVQSDLQNRGASALFQELLVGDPRAAEKIHVNDHYRLTRALEVLRGKSTTMTSAAQNKQKLFNLNVMKVGLSASKEDLRVRVQRRTAQMLLRGLVQEVEAMVTLGRGEWAPLSSVGYLETKRYLQGELSFAELAPEIELKTMQLIKKQMTWFKRDSSIIWREPGQGLDLVPIIKEFFLGAAAK